MSIIKFSTINFSFGFLLSHELHLFALVLASFSSTSCCAHVSCPLSYSLWTSFLIPFVYSRKLIHLNKFCKLIYYCGLYIVVEYRMIVKMSSLRSIEMDAIAWNDTTIQRTRRIIELRINGSKWVYMSIEQLVSACNPVRYLLLQTTNLDDK